MHRTSPRQTSPKDKYVCKKDSRIKLQSKKKTLCKHRCIEEFEIEEDKRYFADGFDMHNSKCMNCGIKFGVHQNPPSPTQPVFVCKNRMVSGCQHAYCGVCYTGMLTKNTPTGLKRSSRRR